MFDGRRRHAAVRRHVSQLTNGIHKLTSLNLPLWNDDGRPSTGKCQNVFFFKIGKCQNWKVSESESVRIGKCQNYLELEKSYV